MNKPRPASDALSRDAQGVCPGAHAASAFVALPSAAVTVIAMMLVPHVAHANPCPLQPAVIDMDKSRLGRNHHPIGASLPARPEFHQPLHCDADIWYFDINGNGIPDPGEVRVFGSKRQVDCPSCHGDSPERKSAASASAFLRRDAATLCLVCHKL